MEKLPAWALVPVAVVLGVLLVALLWAKGRTQEQIDRDAASAVREARAACASMLRDPIFRGEGKLEKSGERLPTECVVRFDLSDDALATFKVSTACDASNSIALVFRRTSTSWRLDRFGSLRVDNRPCEIFIRAD